MVARIAKSQSGSAAQYVGTTKVSSPANYGSAFSRSLNGTSDRVVGPRSSDLGPTFMLTLFATRTTADTLTANQVVSRLFSQHCVGGTRVAFGIERSFLALQLMDSSGTPYTVESRVQVLDVLPHCYALVVHLTKVELFFDGRLALSVDILLKAPSTERCVIGADRADRFFRGQLHDVAAFQTLPNNYRSWLAFQRDLFTGAAPRDAIWSGFSAGFNNVAVSPDGFTATGMSPISRVGMSQTLRGEAELDVQTVEFRFFTSDPDCGVGVFTGTHDLSADALGTTPGSYLFTQDGLILLDNLQISSGFGTWSGSNVMALRWTASTRDLALLKDGVQLVSLPLPAGTWTIGLNLAGAVVEVNAGQRPSIYTAANDKGLPSKAWSRLTTEFRHLKLGEVAAPLDGVGTSILDAGTGGLIGEHAVAPTLLPGLTGDSFDVSVSPANLITLYSGDHTAADTNFFAGLAFKPAAGDLVGEHVLLECDGKWGLKLVDNNLVGWIGALQVTTEGNYAVSAEGFYLVAISAVGGSLRLWANGQYGATAQGAMISQAAGAVSVGSAPDGGKKFAGKLSHVFLSSSGVPAWKLARLQAAAPWSLTNWGGSGYGLKYGAHYGSGFGAEPTPVDSVDPGGPAPGTHTYWRVFITEGVRTDVITVGELEFRATSGGLDQCTGGTPISSGSFSSDYSHAKAFDDLNSTMWAAPDAATQASPGYAGPAGLWIGYHFASPVGCAEVAVTTDNGSFSGNAGPKSFKVQYSDDGIAWWDSWVVSNQPGVGYGTTTAYPKP